MTTESNSADKLTTSNYQSFDHPYQVKHLSNSEMKQLAQTDNFLIS